MNRKQLTVVYDTEIFDNAFLATFYIPDTKKYKEFLFYETVDKKELKRLRAFLASVMVAIGFNSLKFDNPIINKFLKTGSIEKTKQLANQIIGKDSDGNPIRKTFPKTSFIGNWNTKNHDVFIIHEEKGSLKEYQCRMALERVINYDNFKYLPEEDIDSVKEYCRWDCYSTYKLWSQEDTQAKLQVKEQLCKTYHIKGSSRTESAFSETILQKELRKALNLSANQKIQNIRTPKMSAIGRDFIDPKISFNKPELQHFLEKLKSREFKSIVTERGEEPKKRNKSQNVEFDWGDKPQHKPPKKPKGKKLQWLGEQFNEEMTLAGINLKLGIGGIHSKDKKAAIIKPTDGQIINVDVSSYYPSTITNLKVAPTGIEKQFINIYAPLLQDRLNAKREGRKVYANSVKIVLNAVYGKLSDVKSCLFNPISSLTVTINCQLYFLMLLERLESLDTEILQVNTDGICCYVKNNALDKFDQVLQKWQDDTNFQLDKDVIDGVIIKSTNDYAWLKDDKVIKEKGTGFKTQLSLFAGCTFPISSAIAVQEYFINGTNPRETITRLVQEKKWVNFAIWQKAGEKNKKSVLRYIIAKKGELEAGVTSWGRPIQNAKDFNALSWNNLDIETYIERAEDSIQNFKTDNKTTNDFFTNIPDSDSITLNIEKFASKKETFARDSRTFISDKAINVPIKKVLDKLLDQGEYYIAHQGNKRSLQTKSRGRKYLTYGENAPQLSKLSFISLNPYIHGSTTKGKGNVAHKNCVTIEFDNMSLQEQWQRLQNVPHTAIVYSGGKSLHCHIRFQNELTDNQYERLTQYLRTLFGDSDNATWIINQYVRFPGGYNYDTNTHQTILSVKNRVPYDNLMEWLEYERNSQGLKLTELETTATTDLTEARLPLQTYYEYALDDILLKKGFRKSTQRSKAGLNIVYTGNCPRSFRHTNGKSHNTEFQVFVNATGVVSKHCHHSTCKSDAIEKMSLNDLGFKIPKTRYTDSFFKTDKFKSLGISQREFKRIRDGKTKETANERKIKGLKPLEIKFDAAYKKVYEHKKIKDKLQSINDAEAFILSMPTGTGKSTLMLQAAKHLVDVCGERVVFVTSTRNELERATQYLKFIGVQSEEIEWFVSNHNSDVEDEHGKVKTKKNAKYIITTLGYWGRKGELATVYSAFSDRIQGAVVMFDECHVMLQRSIVNKQLTALYKVENYDANKTTKFTLGGEYHICNKTRGQMSQYNERSFHKDFVIAAINNYKVDKTYGILDPEIVEGRSIKDFQNAESTVFCTTPEDWKLGEKPDHLFSCKEESTYFNSLCTSLDNFHLKTELPLWKETREPISFYELQKLLDKEKECDDFNIELLKDKFQNPKQTPFVTYMSGYDMLGFWQLTGMNVQNTTGKIVEYKRPKSIIFASATIPYQFKATIEKTITNEFKLEQISNEKPPAKFDVTLLKTTEAISANNVEEIVTNIIEKLDEKALVVVPTKQKASNLFHALSGQQGVNQFVEKVYEKIVATQGPGTQIEKNVEDRVMVTYPGSSICKGANLSDYQILMVDARIFAPLASFTCNSQSDIREAQKNALHGGLTQIVGRLLRTLLKIKVGKVVEDPRKIVMVLYGLPEQLKDFSIDQSLTHSYTEHSDTWLSTRKNSIVESVLQNITNVLNESDIQEYKTEEITSTSEKHTRHMSKKERELTKHIRNQKKQRKAQANHQVKFEKLLQETQNFDTWRDFLISKNVHNKKWISKEMKQILKQSFDK